MPDTDTRTGTDRRGLSPQRYVQATRWALWSLTVIVVTGSNSVVGAIRRIADDL